VPGSVWLGLALYLAAFALLLHLVDRLASRPPPGGPPPPSRESP